MKYINEFRDNRLARSLIDKISENAKGLENVRLMEVCGTHTMAIARHGIRGLLPKNLELISGPGCPVCVTSNEYLDKAIAMGRLNEVILTTFGDMMRVPGSTGSLEDERADGRNIRVVYSTIDALEIACKNPNKNVIFLGIGFETTTPTTAAAILKAQELDIENFFLLCGHKTMPKPMEMIAKSGRSQLDGFICPGHVSAVIGSKPYEFLSEDYGKACVIAGFEPLDILESINLLLGQMIQEKMSVEIQYSRAVAKEGNPVALEVMNRIFEPIDADWRGIGSIPESGLRIRAEYSQFDAEASFVVTVEPTQESHGCICGEVMQGIVSPVECKLFGRKCTPEKPVGPCMVSSEGSCAAWFKYEQPFIGVES